MIDPRSVLPPQMARLVAETEAREQNEAALAEFARRDEAEARAVMFRHQEHVFEAQHGYGQAEWREAQQARGDALAAAGFDASAVVGSEGRPEQLIDGGSLTPSKGPAARAEAEARRYQTTSGIDAVLRRNADESAAWSSPPMRRVRQAALEDEIRRTGGTVPPREIRRTSPPPSPLPVQVIPERWGAPAVGDF